MKYLLDKNCKVTMKGTKISARTDETLYDPKVETYSKATMKEIAETNGFEVKGRTEVQIKASFDEALSQLKLTRVNTMALNEKLIKVVQDGVDDENTETEILIEMVNTGEVKFKHAPKIFNQIKIKLGLEISPEDRKTKSQEIMDDDGFEPETYADVTTMVKQIAADVPNTSEPQALAQIKLFCKDNEIDLPKKPKGSGVPFSVKAIAFMAKTPDATNDDFEEFLEENNRGETVVARWLKTFGQFKTEMGIKDEPAKPAAKKGRARAKK